MIPRRILVGTRSHAAVIAALRVHRPGLEYRGAVHTDVTPGDLAWADTYVGFKRPPAAATMGGVQWVHCTGAGVDSWLSPVELDRSVLLTRTPESFGPAIAEWVVARVFAVQQQLGELAAAQREHRWAPRDMAPVAGTRALVVGTGDVGSAVAEKLAALEVTVTGVSRTGVANTSLERALAGAHPAFDSIHAVAVLGTLVSGNDWIVLTLPDTPATRGLFSRDVMSKCNGAVLINTGRGSVVDESALPEALDRGWLRGAALDVFTVEPLPASSPLWEHPRVMISPHCSGPTTVAGAVNGFLECLEAVEQGLSPRWAVDRDRGY